MWPLEERTSYVQREAVKERPFPSDIKNQRRINVHPLNHHFRSFEQPRLLFPADSQIPRRARERMKTVERPWRKEILKRSARTIKGRFFVGRKNAATRREKRRSHVEDLASSAMYLRGHYGPWTAGGGRGEGGRK